MPTTKMRGEEDHLASSDLITTGPVLEEMHETTLMGGGEEDAPITETVEGSEEDFDPDRTTFAEANPFGTF